MCDGIAQIVAMYTEPGDHTDEEGCEYDKVRDVYSEAYLPQTGELIRLSI